MSSNYHMEDEVQRKAYDHLLMRRLLGFVRPYRAWMFLATVLLFVAAIVSNLNPLVVMWSVDYYINNPVRMELASDDMDVSGDAAAISSQADLDMQGLLGMTMLLALLVIMEGVVRYIQALIVALVGQRTMYEMRVGLFEHLQCLSLRFLDRNPVGRLMSRVTSDVEKIQQTVVTGVVQVVNDLLTIVVVLAFMLYFNWHLALLAISPVPLVFLTSWLFRKYAHRSFLEIRKKIARVSANMQENVSGMRIAQLFLREDANYDTYRALNADHRDEWLLQIRNFALYFPVIEFFGTLSTAIIFVYCGIQIFRMDEMISGVASVGTFYMYVFLSDRFFMPIRQLADRYNLLLEAMASSERVFQLLDTEPEILDKPDAVTPKIPGEPDAAQEDHPEIQGAVDFDDVWFAYEGDQHVLKGVSFHIEPGEKVAIVGHTGAGKSTIINLLSRFYDIQQGAIRVDGVDVRDYNQIALRRNIGMVLQDVFLFSGTIEENIRLGNENLSMEQVKACAAYVNAAGFIDRLSGGYQYNVGERGSNLSTGQRQLLAFARTLAHEPSILVLDEATSSIDTETEALIQDAIAKLMADRTSIVIAHRLSTVQHADRIIVMHHGEIREIGTHQELLMNGGLYRTLYELQYKDQDVF